VKLSNAVAKIIESLSPKQRAQCKDAIDYLTETLAPPTKITVEGTGQHWKHKRETDRCYLIVTHDGIADLLTYNELLARTGFKPQSLAVHLSKGKGKYSYHHRGETTTITHLRN
jgi:hypothetical protein